MRARILLVARDVALRGRLARLLKSAGQGVELAENAAHARRIGLSGFAVAVVAPDGIGPDAKALMTELDTQGAKVLTLGMAPDSLDPSDEAWLLGRITEATRSPLVADESEPVRCFGGFRLDLAAHVLTDNGGNEVPLTRGEFNLLREFVHRPGRVLSRDHLLQALAGRDAESYDRSIDMLMVRLRRKIEPDPKRPSFIVTVPGSGYKFKAKVTSEAAEAIVSAEATPVGPRASPPATSERRQLTIMQCMLTGPAFARARSDPEDLQRLLAGFRQRCEALVNQAGGTVDQLLSDGALIYFGYPQADEHQAERAVRAALKLVATADQIDTGQDGRLQIRIGIATGLAVVGGQSGAAGTLGEAANLAARLASSADPGAVLISVSTRRIVGGLFACREHKPITSAPSTLANSAELVDAWQVTGESAAEGRFEALHNAALLPLVGREEELDLSLRRWEQAKAGRGNVVLVTGEPGIGKSRLIRAFQDAISGQPHIELRLFCSPHHQDSALYPVITGLERSAGFTRGDTDEAKLTKLGAVLAQSNATDDEVALIAELLSVPTDRREYIQSLTPQVRRERTLVALVRSFSERAAKQPLLGIFEDAHWIDPTSRELIDRTIYQLERLPALLLVTFRPEFQAPRVGQSLVTMLTLRRLDRRDVAALIDNVAGANTLTSEISREIADRTDGVPLFIEEQTKAVIEAGAQTSASSSTVLHPALSVPATLQSSLMARLDQLGPLAKDVAQTGAVIGREFDDDLLTSISDLPEQQLGQALHKLTNSGLLFVRGAPQQATYLFKHAMVQDAAYGMLLRGRRRQLHERIGTALETRRGGAEAARPEVLAHHFTEAGQIERAVGCLLDAGKQALRRSGMAEAEALLRRALALLPRLPDGARRQGHELDLQLALGRALIATKGWGTPAVGEAYGRARQLSDRLNRRRELLPILYGQFVHHALRADLQYAERIAMDMWQLGEEQEDVVARVMACRISGYASLAIGDFAAARSHLERGVALYDPADQLRYAELSPQNVLPTLLSFLSCALACCGHLDQARARRESAITEARRLSHGYTSAYTLWWVLYVGWLARAEPGVLLETAEEILALSAEGGFGFWTAMVSANRGWCLAALGDPEYGISLLAAGLNESRNTGHSQFTPAALVMLADANRIAGQPQAGLDYLAEAERLAKATKEQQVLAETHRLHGDLLILVGERAGAEARYHRAMAIAQNQGAKLFELRSATSLARLWRNQGRRAEARAVLEPVYGWFTEGFDAADLKDAKRLLEELQVSGD